MTSISLIVLISLVIGMILGGILMLKKSAKKFNLTPEQLIKIKKRNEELAREDQDD